MLIISSCVCAVVFYNRTQAQKEEKGSTAAAVSTEDLDNETSHQQRQEWNSCKDALSTCSGGDLSVSPVTRSLYVSGDHLPRSQPFEFDVGCREFVDKFTTRLVNSSK